MTASKKTRVVKSISQVCDEVGYLKAHFFADEVVQVVDNTDLSGDEAQVKFREFVLSLIEEKIPNFVKHQRTSQALDEDEKTARKIRKQLESEDLTDTQRTKLSKALEILDS